MLSRTQIEHAAEQLYIAEKERCQIPALTLQYPEMDMDDAYAIQKSWVDRKIAEGAKVKGYKIGLTSRAMQMASNIDQPDFGVLLDDMFFEDGAQIITEDFLDPRIEVELAFILNKPLQGENVTIFDVLNATDYVVPALELIAAAAIALTQKRATLVRCTTPYQITRQTVALSSAGGQLSRQSKICAGLALSSILTDKLKKRGWLLVF